MFSLFMQSAKQVIQKNKTQKKKHAQNPPPPPKKTKQPKAKQKHNYNNFEQ